MGYDRDAAKNKVLDWVEEFLDQPFVECDDGGYPAVTDAHLRELTSLIEKIIAHRFDTDCEGSPSIGFKLVNKREEYALHSPNIPHFADDDSNAAEVLAALTANLNAAANALANYRWLFENVKVSGTKVGK